MFRVCIIFICSLLVPGLLLADVTWTPLKPGLAYTTIPLNEYSLFGKLHAFRINLDQYDLKLAFAKDTARDSSYVKTLSEPQQGVIAINGGFFSPEHTPLGLRIQDGTIRSKLKRTSWWGVFYIKNNKAYITSQKKFRYSKNIRFAIQAGPRLIVNKKIPPLKKNFDERSAICIDNAGKVILVATERASLSTTQLASILSRLNCVNALNLDGGNSSQLYANIDKFNLHIQNLSQVSDAILVVPKS